MEYAAAVAYLLSLGRELAAPTQAAAAKFNLENITVLDERLGHPSRAYPTAHIAGTNGKGSTAAFLESILRHAGLRTGLNTSPHLEKINERIRVDGKEISDEDFAAAFKRIHEVIEQLLAEGKLRAHPTYFECVTAMATAYFAQQRVDFAVFEVGLGGRLDATNILAPVVTIITPVDFDHENFLGHSLHEIAGEKAGILKPNTAVVVAPQLPEARGVILRRAKDLACPVIETNIVYRIHEKPASIRQAGSENFPAGTISATIEEISSGWSLDISPSLAGQFQVQNALSAVAAARILAAGGLHITDDAMAAGISNTVWPGRLEKLQAHPDVYLDGAHNPAAARELATFLAQNFASRKIWLIYGALRDKSVDEVAGWLFPLAAEVVFTEPRTPRSISASQLAEIAGYHARHSETIPDAEKALDSVLANAQPDDAIFVCGSLYLVGQLRAYWKNRARVAANPKTP
ncbi:MAG TPA: folylpolyglutamate synthase/dihydrofolate synthase family protein [Candidatus Acidoferrum sp.]|jgi:dihydrofolate synthase/folylpolyglutamate synthase|nr:folylpolyglutamate synthase/dihydrofolate synthase family protein [Candidatus Acidoferrum sp.]